jgi:hypothetical protein
MKKRVPVKPAAKPLETARLARVRGGMGKPMLDWLDLFAVSASDDWETPVT